jgi:hypothetical protein
MRNGTQAQRHNILVLAFTTVVLFIVGTPSAPAQTFTLYLCKNGSSNSPSDCSGSNWSTGNGGASNSHNTEGGTIAYRAVLNGLTVNNTYTMDLQYTTKFSSLHAIDYLTSPNVWAPGSPATSVDPCSGVSGLTIGSTTIFSCPVTVSSSGSMVYLYNSFDLPVAGYVCAAPLSHEGVPEESRQQRVASRAHAQTGRGWACGARRSAGQTFRSRWSE